MICLLVAGRCRALRSGCCYIQASRRPPLPGLVSGSEPGCQPHIDVFVPRNRLCILLGYFVSWVDVAFEQIS